VNFVDLGGNNDAFNDLAEDASGRLIAAGFAGDVLAEHDFAVARFGANGSLDSDFDADGIVTTDFLGGGDQAEGVVIQGDGKNRHRRDGQPRQFQFLARPCALQPD
jgi:hypothetical protein